jgi:hypothetical protein
MNDVVVVDETRLIAIARREVARIADLPEDLRRGALVSYDPRAKRTADEMSAQLDEKPSPERVLEWLTKLNFAVANPVTVAELRARLGTYYAALGSYYPVPCWTDASLGEACRRCKFFPGTAELADFMDVELARCRAAVEVLRRMANPPAPVPRLSCEPYPVQMPPPEREPRLARGVGLPRGVDPIRSVEEQLAALGYERDPANPGKVRAV